MPNRATTATTATETTQAPTFTSPFGAPVEATVTDAPKAKPQRRMSQSEIAEERLSAAMLVAIQNRVVEDDEDDFF
ncbi:hypothetical protein CspeluHIS016_0803070 [Cutaneotrichosporon spelunceum]|uniref:Uncharacterized protein n=1 Tax=Cutaneotrichosporon spelunceum TaxID=1672016 RepID=A0AAD3U007_9TREE|nr:hypothetical protein CspeluHIS016_0803070 [Cutaneotrichosporon spelunceum]